MSNLQEFEIEESILNMSRALLGADRLIVILLDDKQKPERIIASGDSNFANLNRALPPLRHLDARIEVDDRGAATITGRYDDASYVVAQFSRLQLSAEETLTRVRALLPYLLKFSNSQQRLRTARRLPGRAACLDRIQHQIDSELWTKRRRSFSIIRATLGSLDHVNHFYGWDVANQLIDKLTMRLTKEVGRQTFVGYSGGGNYIFITAPGQGKTVISKRIDILRLAATAPLTLGDIHYTPDVNFAAVSYPDDGLTPSALLRNVDMEVQKKSKHRLQTMPCLAGASENPLASAQNFEQNLHAAIENNELYLEWQPTTATTTMKVISREALLRWARPNYGPVYAASLIPCAETSGLIDRLDAWSLKAACQEATRWKDSLPVCVNVSPTWLAQERLALLVEDILQETGLPARRLQIEFNENTDFGPNKSVYRELVKLRALGVVIALDDFGTGFSSLERLSYYPVDKIKVARSFLAKLGEDSRSCRILQHIVHLARSLNIVCCAKGVETEQQMAFLASYGYEEVQGFLMGVPRKTSAQDAINPFYGHQNLQESLTEP